MKNIFIKFGSIALFAVLLCTVGGCKDNKSNGTDLSDLNTKQITSTNDLVSVTGENIFDLDLSDNYPIPDYNTYYGRGSQGSSTTTIATNTPQHSAGIHWSFLLVSFVCGIALTFKNGLLIKCVVGATRKLFKRWKGAPSAKSKMRGPKVDINDLDSNNTDKEETTIEETEVEANPNNGQWAKLNKNSKIREILAIFDNIYGTELKDKFTKVLQNYSTFQEKATYYDSIVNSENEEQLLSILNEINCKVNVVSLDSIYSKTKDMRPVEAIAKILTEIDSIYKTQFTALYSRYHRDSKSVDEIKKHFNTTSNSTLADLLTKAKEQYISSQRGIADAITLLSIFKFKEDSPSATDRLAELADILKNIKSNLNDIKQKEEYYYWDRVAIILMAVSKCLIPLLNYQSKGNGITKNEKAILDAIKSDMVSTYATRFFIRDVQKSEVSAEAFRTEVNAKLKESTEKFNTEHAKTAQETSLSATDLPQENLTVFEEAIKQVRAYENYQVFSDKMWTTFVQEFLNKAPQCNKGFVLAQALNIAFHTADFLDHIKGGRSIPYCFNYKFLLNDFDPEKSGCQKFEHNHYMHSTNYSNFIYELAQELGAKDLKILVENYLINS